MADKQGTWLDTLKDLTPIALESGMKRLKALSAGEKFVEFPPNCLQFRAICLSYYSELSLPTVGAAFNEITANYYDLSKIENPILKYIASKLTPAFFQIRQPNEAFQQFKSVYEKVSSLIKQGHTLPEVNLSTSQALPRSQAVASTHLNAMKTMLGARV